MTSILDSTNRQSSVPSAQPESPSTEQRFEFWADTCREVNEMRLRSPRVLELYQKHGCVFVAPTHEQVGQVLEALDNALAGWEQEHPELFYQALQLNFPELVRHR